MSWITLQDTREDAREPRLVRTRRWLARWWTRQEKRRQWFVLANPQLVASWRQLSAMVIGTTAPLALLVARRAGHRAGERSAVGLAAALGAQHWLVEQSLPTYRRVSDGHVGQAMDRADLLTLSRGAAAAVLFSLAVSGAGQERGLEKVAWGALLWGIGSDWLDGRLARRRGATELGAYMDLEADSWLTLASATLAVADQRLPWWFAVAPALRYVLPVERARRAITGSQQFQLSAASRWSDRVTGVAQMGVITAALAPARHVHQSPLLVWLRGPVALARLFSVALQLIDMWRPLRCE